MLANYRKFEFKNPYLSALTEIKDIPVLQAVYKIITEVLSEKNRNTLPDKQPSWFKWYGTTQNTPANLYEHHTCVILLTLYEFVNGNKTFVGIITNKEKPELKLINTFLTFCVHSFSTIKESKSERYGKLCFLILLRFTEYEDCVSFFSRNDNWNCYTNTSTKRY